MTAKSAWAAKHNRSPWVLAGVARLGRRRQGVRRGPDLAAAGNHGGLHSEIAGRLASTTTRKNVRRTNQQHIMMIMMLLGGSDKESALCRAPISAW